MKLDATKLLQQNLAGGGAPQYKTQVTLRKLPLNSHAELLSHSPAAMFRSEQTPLSGRSQNTPSVTPEHH